MTDGPPPPPADLPLAGREGLPDDLRVLLADYPRDHWPSHPDFNGLVAFWLDRHGEFRRLLSGMKADAESLIGLGMDPTAYRRRLSQSGSIFLQNLTGHHQIEDRHYFPQLAQMEHRLQRGFDMLDRDHHDLEDWLKRFADEADAALSAPDDAALREAAARFRGGLKGLGKMLDRHLTDEEDLILPVILKHRVG
jgi:iron-sulfur cluster repair protein YtfE (RIC family)